ncbi:MAG: hypothetical protein GPJ54_13705 [Candidatus Heimdallarchaeota archaeon]|nr:hypothetical protein [Candidatus Heimdallarchaeota archaeon]
MAEEKTNNLKLVMEALGEEAMKNDHLTYEELQILKQVSFDLSQYERALKNALEDGIITENENTKLSYLKDQIEKNVLTVANIDSVVDAEEEGLISRLCEVLVKYL